MIEVFLQYGIAGLTLYILYFVVRRLMNHLSELTESISKLNESIVEMRTIIKMLIELVKSK